MKITQIGLSLTNRCSANCIFCPSTKKRTDDMSLELVQRIVNEVNSDNFQSKHDLKSPHHTLHINLSENGDALLNVNLLDILRCLKTIKPRVWIMCNTTFHNMTKELSEIIVKEKLIDEITTYIDGEDSLEYEKVKRIPYKTIENNLINFIEINDCQIKLNIFYLGLGVYINAIYKAFGRLPNKIKNDEKFTIDELLKDNYPIIKRKLANVFLKSKNSQTSISRATIFAWAERETVKELRHDQKQFACPLINKIKTECFISPNGNMYACYYDETQNIIFGNITNNSINTIFNSKKRLDFFNHLKNRDYDKIGYPCNLVESCQRLDESEEIINMVKKTHSIIKYLSKNPQVKYIYENSKKMYIKVQMIKELVNKIHIRKPLSNQMILFPESFRGKGCLSSLSHEGVIECINCGNCDIGKAKEVADNIGYKVLIISDANFIKKQIELLESIK